MLQHCCSPKTKANETNKRKRKNSWWIMGVELYGIDTTQLCIRPTRHV